MCLFRINYTDDGKKHGECSLFSSLEFASHEPVSNYENPISNSLPLTTVNNVIPAHDVKFELQENVTVCSNSTYYSITYVLLFFFTFFLHITLL